MLRIAFAGTPEFAAPALRALAQSAQQLVGVLTQPDRPAGRGRKLQASAVKQLALTLGVPLAQPVTLKSEHERAQLAAWAPDLLVVVAYGLILPPAALSLPRLGCLNIHASLLPRWRGAAPIQRAILAGDRDSGITIMQMEAGLDTGPMLRQQRVPIGSETSTAQLHDELAALGAKLLIEVIEDVEAGRVQAQPQPTAGVTYAAKIDKREALIDWSGRAADIARQVRAFNPWPVAQTQLAGEPLRIWEAHELQDPGAASRLDDAARPPGSLLGLVGEALRVSCAEGVLAIARLQLAGRRVVTAREFANGRDLAQLRFG